MFGRSAGTGNGRLQLYLITASAPLASSPPVDRVRRKDVGACMHCIHVSILGRIDDCNSACIVMSVRLISDHCTFPLLHVWS